MKGFRQRVWIYLMITWSVSQHLDTVAATEQQENPAKKSTDAAFADSSEAENSVRPAEDQTQVAVSPMFRLTSTKLQRNAENDDVESADRGIGNIFDGSSESRRGLVEQSSHRSAIDFRRPSKSKTQRARAKRKRMRKKKIAHATKRDGGDRLRIATTFGVTRQEDEVEADRFNIGRQPTGTKVDGAEVPEQERSGEHPSSVSRLSVDESQAQQQKSQWRGVAEEARRLRKTKFKRKKPSKVHRLKNQQSKSMVDATSHSPVSATDSNSTSSKSSRTITNAAIQHTNHHLLRSSTSKHPPEPTIGISNEAMANDNGQAGLLPATLSSANTTGTVAGTVVDYLHSVVHDPTPVIVGDLSCLKDKFRPAPTVANADIKYLRNELLGQTNAYLEAEYICLPGFRLARTNHSTTVFCRRRRWIGHAPRCEPRSPTADIETATAAIPTEPTLTPMSSFPGTCPPSDDVEERRRCHRPLCRPAVGKSSASAAVLAPANRRSCRLCRTGFQLNESDNLCWDIDECRVSSASPSALSNGTICPPGTMCKNTIGSFRCECGLGFQQELLSVENNDDTGRHHYRLRCTDINECRLRNGHGPCQDVCANFDGGYRCSCDGLPGTTLATDGHSCDDVDECLDNNGGCSHTCLNTLGRAFCVCPDGWLLDEDDWRTCRDVDECADPGRHCGPQLECVNTLGSYRCVPAVASVDAEEVAVQSRCPESQPCAETQTTNMSTTVTLSELKIDSDEAASASRSATAVGAASADDGNEIYVADPDAVRVACPPLFPPKHGYLECSRPLPDRRFDNGEAADSDGATGNAASGGESNRPGSQCILRCPTGFWEAGRFEKICDFNGRWVGEDGGMCIKYQSPVLSCPPDIVVEVSPNAELAHVRIPAATTTDVNWDRDVQAEPGWAHQRDAQLPVGFANVTLTARQPLAPELSVTCAFSVTVLDGEPPVVQFCPRNRHHVLADGEQRAPISWTEPHFSDNIGISVITKTSSPGNVFGVGSHRIVYTAHDSAGYKTRCIFKLIVTATPTTDSSNFHHQLRLPMYSVY